MMPAPANIVSNERFVRELLIGLPDFRDVYQIYISVGTKQVECNGLNQTLAIVTLVLLRTIPQAFGILYYPIEHM